MYFPLVFQVIGRTCFRFTPAAITIVHSVLHTCSDWPAEGTGVLTGPKCNKGPIRNNIRTQL